MARYSALTNGITRAVEDQRLIYSAMAINAAAGIITAFGLVFCLRLRYESLFSAEISGTAGKTLNQNSWSQASLIGGPERKLSWFLQQRHKDTVTLEAVFTASEAIRTDETG